MKTFTLRRALKARVWMCTCGQTHTGQYIMGFQNDLSPLTSHPTDIWPVPPVKKKKRKERVSRQPEKNRLITMKRKLHEGREGCCKSSWWVTSSTDWFMGDWCEMRLNSERQIADTVTIYYWDPVAWISISLAMLQMLSCELNYSRMTGSINYLNLCHNTSHADNNWSLWYLIQCLF